VSAKKKCHEVKAKARKVLNWYREADAVTREDLQYDIGLTSAEADAVYRHIVALERRPGWQEWVVESDEYGTTRTEGQHYVGLQLEPLVKAIESASKVRRANTGQRSISDEDLQFVFAMLEAGETQSSVARAVGVPQPYISRWVSTYRPDLARIKGRGPRSEGVDSKRIEALCLLREGATLRAAATQAGIDPGQFSKWVRKAFPEWDYPGRRASTATARRSKNPIALQSYTAFCNHLADAYDEAPEYDEDEAWRWEKLAKHIRKFYKRISRKLDIQFVDGQPYDNAEEMRDAVQATGTMYISREGNEHPYFDAATNLEFRAVHDYVVHILPGEGGPDFSEKGEVRAYNLHRQLAPPDTWPALFTEVAAQACYFNVRGEFPVQKVAVIPGFDYYRVGLTDAGTALDSYHPRQAMGASPDGVRRIKSRLLK